MDKRKPLFEVQGKPVYKDDILYHPDVYRTGGKVRAEFPSGDDYVTVRSVPSGAVPTVKISELSWTIPLDVLDTLVLEKQLPARRISEHDLRVWRLGREAGLKGLVTAALADDQDMLKAYLSRLQKELPPNAAERHVVNAVLAKLNAGDQPVMRFEQVGDYPHQRDWVYVSDWRPAPGTELFAVKPAAAPVEVPLPDAEVIARAWFGSEYDDLGCEAPEHVIAFLQSLMPSLAELEHLKSVAENNFIAMEKVTNYLAHHDLLQLNHDGEGEAAGNNIVDSIETLRQRVKDLEQQLADK